MSIEAAMIIMAFSGGTVGYVAGFFVARAIYRSPTWPS